MNEPKYLATRQECNELYQRLNSDNVICLWATGYPVQSVELCLAFKQVLEGDGHKVVMLMRSNAIPYFEYYSKLYNDSAKDFVFICDRDIIFKHLHYIKLLFIHDYTLNFSYLPCDHLKICFFPHSAHSLYPNTNIFDFMADYIITNNFDKNFKFNYFNLSCKYQNLTIIKGYPKLDLLYSRSKNVSILDSICWFPTLLVLICKEQNTTIIKDYFIALIRMCLQSFCDYNFILRPRSEDINDPFFISIKNKFADDKRFIYDTSADSYGSLVRSSILIGDQGGVSDNFALALGRPVLTIDYTSLNDQEIKKTKYGYKTSAIESVNNALQLIFSNMKYIKKELNSLHNKGEIKPGQFLSFLSSHIYDMMHNRYFNKTFIYERIIHIPTKERIDLYIKNFKECFMYNYARTLFKMIPSKYYNDSSIYIKIIIYYNDIIKYNPPIGVYKYMESYLVWILTRVPCTKLARIINYLKNKSDCKNNNGLLYEYLLMCININIRVIQNYSIKDICFDPENNLYFIINQHRLMRLIDVKHKMIEIKDIDNNPNFYIRRSPVLLFIYAALIFETNKSKFNNIITSLMESCYINEYIPTDLYLLYFHTLIDREYITQYFYRYSEFPTIIMQTFFVEELGKIEYYLDKFITQHGYDPTAIKFLLQIYKTLNNIDKLHNYINTLIEREPQNTVYYVMQANLYMEEKRYDEASIIIEKIYDIELNSLAYYFNKAALLSATDRLDEAIHLVKKAMQIYPDGNFEATLCSYLRRRGDWKEVRQLAVSCLKSRPNEDWAWSNLAMSAAAEGNYKRAIALIRVAIRRSHQPFRSGNILCEYLIKIGDDQGAKQSAQDMLNRIPGLSWPHLFLSDIAKKANDLASAIYHARQALATQPYSVDGLRRLAALMQKKEFWFEVSLVCAKAISANKFQQWAWMWKADAEIRISNRDKAMGTIRQALEIFPESAQLKNKLDEYSKIPTPDCATHSVACNSTASIHKSPPNKIDNGTISKYRNCVFTPFKPQKKGHHKGIIGANQLDGTVIPEAMYFTGDKCSPCVSLINSATQYHKRIDFPVIYGGCRFGSYGHFITEGLSRLWYCAQSDLPVIFLDKKENLKPYAYDLFKLLGIDNKIIFIDEPTLCGEVIFPWPAVMLNSYFDSYHAAWLGQYKCEVEKGKRIFLSRKMLPENLTGHTQDDERLEDIFRKAGYKIVYPELLPIEKQLYELDSSELVVGIESSAFHSVIFLEGPIQTRFVSIGRHRNGSGIFNHIKNVKNINYKTINLHEDKIKEDWGMNLDFYKLQKIMKDDPLLTNIDQFTFPDELIIPPNKFSAAINWVKKSNAQSTRSITTMEFKSLSELGEKYGTDKSNHKYLDFYDSIFKSFRTKHFTMLEMGVYKGQSLRMWREYFPNAKIIGVDMTKKHLEGTLDNIDFRIMNIDDSEAIINLVEAEAPILVIDDASHRWRQQISLFINIFPKLPPQAIYIIEDIHTSFPQYNDIYGDYSIDTSSFLLILSLYIINKTQAVIHPLYKSHIDIEPAIRPELYENIDSITFRSHCCIIKKR